MLNKTLKVFADFFSKLRETHIAEDPDKKNQLDCIIATQERNDELSKNIAQVVKNDTIDNFTHGLFSLLKAITLSYAFIQMIIHIKGGNINVPIG